MTVEQAAAVCRQWLPREHKEHWEPGLKCGQPCNHTQFPRVREMSFYRFDHDSPMPGPTWDLAGAMLERMPYYVMSRSERTTYISINGRFTAIDKPLDAILIAAAAWIQAQEQR